MGDVAVAMWWCCVGTSMTRGDGDGVAGGEGRETQFVRGRCAAVAFVLKLELTVTVSWRGAFPGLFRLCSLHCTVLEYCTEYQEHADRACLALALHAAQLSDS